jgi:hypothetical protein
MKTKLEGIAVGSQIIATTLAALVTGVTVLSVVLATYLFFRASRTQEQESQQGYEELRDSTREAAPDEKRFLLLAQYHSTSLSQSKISFWFSLIFASLGFVVIVMPITFPYIFPSKSNIVSDAQILNLVSGTIIEAVAALFFVQSNRARRLMVEFFDRLRADKKLDDALQLAQEIGDEHIQGRLKVLLALDFADVRPAPNEGVLASVLREHGFLGVLLNMEGKERQQQSQPIGSASTIEQPAQSNGEQPQAHPPIHKDSR